MKSAPGEPAPAIRVDHLGTVALVRIERPDVLNALDTPSRQELSMRLRDAGDDPDTMAVVLTGSGGRAFCVGQDLREPGGLDAATAVAWMGTWVDLYATIADLPVPSVAVIDGVATGAGLQLALLCDVRVASDTARMGLREVDVGLPAVTGLWLLSEMLGRSRAIELVCTGRLIDAPEGLRVGLVHRVEPAARARGVGVGIAMSISARPAGALRSTLRHVRELTRRAMEDACAAAVRDQSAAIGTGVPQALMAQFLSRRAARRAAV